MTSPGLTNISVPSAPPAPAGLVARQRVLRGVSLTLCACACAIAIAPAAVGTGSYGLPLGAISALGAWWAWMRSGTRIVFRRFVFALAGAPMGAHAAPVSGAWTGYWEQGFVGRQAMSPLELQFDAGRVHGHGIDCVGPFTFEGSCGEGEVRLIKYYLRQHSVLYVGHFDATGSVRGSWWIGSMTGAFELRPQATG